MISWMSEKCNRLMDNYGLSAYGFDKERDGADAEIILEVNGEETERTARIGNVVNLTDDEIERRFAAAAFAIGIAEGIDALVTFADRMLDPSDNGELDEPIPSYNFFQFPPCKAKGKVVYYATESPAWGD